MSLIKLDFFFKCSLLTNFSAAPRFGSLTNTINNIIHTNEIKGVKRNDQRQSLNDLDKFELIIYPKPLPSGTAIQNKDNI